MTPSRSWEQHAGHEPFPTGGKVKMLGVPMLPGHDKAIELYNHIIKNAPFGSYGDQAQYKLAELYQSQGEYELAQKAFWDNPLALYRVKVA